MKEIREFWKSIVVDIGYYYTNGTWLPFACIKSVLRHMGWLVSMLIYKYNM